LTSKQSIKLKVTEHFILLSDIVHAEHSLSHAGRLFIKFISVMEQVGQMRPEV